MDDRSTTGRVLVLGSTGQLGRELCCRFGAAAIGWSLDDLDITRTDDVRRAIVGASPAVVINAAAYTQVDRAEDEPERCYAVNAKAVRYIADACASINARLVQISTDYVFGADGTRNVPYTEDDTPGPLNVYGSSKLAGEQFAAQCPRHLIIRSSGLYGRGGPGASVNFVDTMLRLGEDSLAGRRANLRVVDDQTCSPTAVRDLAQAIVFLLEAGAEGLYHVANRGQATWCEFARAIFRIAGLAVPLEPITTSQYGARAARPQYSVLDTTKYDALGGPPMPTWEIAVTEYLATHG